MAAVAATKTTVAAAGGGAFPSSKLRSSNEISGKVNILCVNQISTSIQEDPWHGAAKFNNSAARSSWLYVPSFSSASLISLRRMIASLSLPPSLSLLFWRPSLFFLVYTQYPTPRSLALPGDIFHRGYLSTIEFLSRALQRHARYRAYLHRWIQYRATTQRPIRFKALSCECTALFREIKRDDAQLFAMRRESQDSWNLRDRSARNVIRRCAYIYIYVYMSMCMYVWERLIPIWNIRSYEGKKSRIPFTSRETEFSFARRLQPQYSDKTLCLFLHSRTFLVLG